ncbi:hypothetical protein HAZT_HAZT004446 [Hyalella azteca]|nr:hypothetical protein HAZT_HAZT004446 [Hyalella azteca]
MILKTFPESEEALELLSSTVGTMAAASSGVHAKAAEQLLQLLGWRKHFLCVEVGPGSKKTHFDIIHRKSLVAYEDMLFFDDEPRNVSEISALGATAVLVDKTDGLTIALVHEGLQRHAGRNLP